MDTSYWDLLQELNGKNVQIKATADGKVTIREVDDSLDTALPQSQGQKINIPIPSYEVNRPISFLEAAQMPDSPAIAGPKGMTLSKMFAHDDLSEVIPDGYILPFGYFNQYLHRTGINLLVETLQETSTTDEILASTILAQIRRRIDQTPIPDDMLNDIMAAHEKLMARNLRRNGGDMN